MSCALYLAATLFAVGLSGFVQADTIFGAGSPGTNSGGPDGANYELGTFFHPTVDGTVDGLRFYVGQNELDQYTGQPAGTFTYTGRLWTAGAPFPTAGPQLVAKDFSSIGLGWNSVTLDSPIAVTANTDYVVSVNTVGGGYYQFLGNAFASSVSNPQNSLVATRGALAFTPGNYPDNSFGSPNGPNYTRDVSFTANSAPPPPPVGSPVGLVSFETPVYSTALGLVGQDVPGWTANSYGGFLSPPTAGAATVVTHGNPNLEGTQAAQLDATTTSGRVDVTRTFAGTSFTADGTPAVDMNASFLLQMNPGETQGGSQFFLSPNGTNGDTPVAIRFENGVISNYLGGGNYSSIGTFTANTADVFAVSLGIDYDGQTFTVSLNDLTNPGTPAFSLTSAGPFSWALSDGIVPLTNVQVILSQKQGVGTFDNIQLSQVAVPEPSTATLMIVAASGLGWLRKRKNAR